jgi:hypothetical protein
MTTEDIWTVGGTLTYLTTAAALEILSSDANDTALGTGARTVKILGLDADHAEIEETLTMDGVTPVATTLSYLRVYRMFVVTAGTGGVNAGTITLRRPAGPVTQAEIAIGDNQTLMSQYTIPASKTAFLLKNYINVGKGQDVTGSLLSRVEGEVFQVKKRLLLFENSIVFPVEPEISFSEKTDIVIRGSTSAGTVAVSAGYSLLVVDDS